MYQTQETVFHRDIQIPRRELKIQRAVGYFWRNSRSWIADETLSQVFDIAPGEIDLGPFEPTEDGLNHFLFEQNSVWSV